ncbi:hypothetical protein HYY70_04500 [Candidatus Woesearchaeota archaeon]|nr:hypothetical protein [Candidatus Woesearchaeota archaeon]
MGSTPRHDVIDAKKLMTDKRIYLGDKGYNSGKKMGKFYDEKVYRMRNSIESVFGSLKRRFGSSVMSRTFKMQRAEILSRIAIYNLNSFFMWLIFYRT